MTADTKQALRHIERRSRQGKFACRIYNWTTARWEAAIRPLLIDRRIKWVPGQIGDEPAITGGWVLSIKEGL